MTCCLFIAQACRAGANKSLVAARFTSAAFSATFAIMTERPDDELKLLALAFDRAWKRYYRPSRIGAISADVARPVLAKHLIASAKEGVVSLDDLAQGGLRHLISLTP
jgi:hypothetical protein